MCPPITLLSTFLEGSYGPLWTHTMMTSQSKWHFKAGASDPIIYTHISRTYCHRDDRNDLSGSLVYQVQKLRLTQNTANFSDFTATSRGNLELCVANLCAATPRQPTHGWSVMGHRASASVDNLAWDLLPLLNSSEVSAAHSSRPPHPCCRQTQAGQLLKSCMYYCVIHFHSSNSTFISNSITFGSPGRADPQSQ